MTMYVRYVASAVARARCVYILMFFCEATVQYSTYYSTNYTCTVRYSMCPACMCARARSFVEAEKE